MSSTLTNSNQDKLRGGYYTPLKITRFVSKWAIKNRYARVLEPSCGDGNFIVAATEQLASLGASSEELNKQVTAVELFEDEAVKARERLHALDVMPERVIVDDFFSFITDKRQSDKATYDVVVGNPPFIRYQNFPEEHRTLAINLMEEQGLSPNRLTNIWIPFLVVCSTLLSESGRLGMVIPAELFQVKYAAETRIFLSKYFERITIVTFKKLVFEGIQQEVVLLLCEKKSPDSKGIRFIELENLSQLDSIKFDQVNGKEVKPVDHSSEKWIKYFLDTDEIMLLREMRQRQDVLRADKIIDVDVGIVTGRNKFFMLDQETVNEWGLENYTQRVVGRSPHIKGLFFTEKDFEDNLSSSHNTLMFKPPNVPFDELPEVCKRYVLHGEEQGHHTGYKCRIRKNWYVVPSVWVPDGFALRQINRFPKLVINRNQASSTDTIHRVRFLNGHNPELVVLSFLNSLTFAFSEITGRSYGGGVMTFEPTEVEELPIPLLKSKDGIDSDYIDKLLRERKIDEVLDIIDHELLVKQLGLSQKIVDDLRAIWLKLSNRRMARKKR
jgi:adenine-specific DNA-methyltransferase